MRSTICLAAMLAVSVATTAFAADGAAIFKQNCASCHGETGTSDTAAGKAMKVPHLAGDAKVAGMSDADIVAAIKANEKHATMLKKVKDDDLAAAAAFVKGLAGGK